MAHVLADHLAVDGSLDFETTSGTEFGDVAGAERPKLVR
jgi:hypothetical protein